MARGIGKQIKYSTLAPAFSHSTVKKAFDLLVQAKVIKAVRSSDPSGIPLGASINSKRFKALMLDIGLLQSLSGLSAEMESTIPDLLDVYRGALAEQFVGQELALANEASQLFYWSRAVRGSSAEIDFLGEFNGQVIPIEVKSGPAGRLRSLLRCLDEYDNCSVAYVFSTAPYSKLSEKGLLFLPLYYAHSSNCATF